MTVSARVSETLRSSLPQSHIWSCYVIKPIVEPPPLWLQKHANLRADDFAHSPHMWHQPRLANTRIICDCSWRLSGI